MREKQALNIVTTVTPPPLLKQNLASASSVADIMPRKYADETVVQVLKKDGKVASSESTIPVYASNGRSGRPIRYSEYQPNRSDKPASVFQKGFTGFLASDDCMDQPP